MVKVEKIPKFFDNKLFSKETFVKFVFGVLCLSLIPLIVVVFFLTNICKLSVYEHETLSIVLLYLLFILPTVPLLIMLLLLENIKEKIENCTLKKEGKQKREEWFKQKELNKSVEYPICGLRFTCANLDTKKCNPFDKSRNCYKDKQPR